MSTLWWARLGPGKGMHGMPCDPTSNAVSAAPGHRFLLPAMKCRAEYQHGFALRSPRAHSGFAASPWPFELRTPSDLTGEFFPGGGCIIRVWVQWGSALELRPPSYDEFGQFRELSTRVFEFKTLCRTLSGRGASIKSGFAELQPVL